MKEADIKKQLEELRKRQEAAMRQMQQAAADLELRKAEVSKAKAELSSTIAERDRVGAEADLAVRAVSEAAEGKALAEGLLERGFGFVDNFLGDPLASYVRDELLDMETKGLLERGELAGGKTGGNTRYTMEAVRGDVVRWVTGSEEGCHNIGLLRELKDQVVFAVKEKVPELEGEAVQRGKLMCTCYPGGAQRSAACGRGGPCRYVRHCDNPDSNGRRLTAIYYLNKGWEPSHGGCLRVYPSDAEGNASSPPVDIEPRHDRLLVFFSDKRVPHEVLDAHHARYAITTWYYSASEREKALAVAGKEQQIEAARIAREIERFQARTGDAPSKVSGDVVGQHTMAMMVGDTPIPGVVHPGAASIDLEELD